MAVTPALAGSGDRTAIPLAHKGQEGAVARGDGGV